MREHLGRVQAAQDGQIGPFAVRCRAASRYRARNDVSLSGEIRRCVATGNATGRVQRVLQIQKVEGEVLSWECGEARLSRGSESLQGRSAYASRRGARRSQSWTVTVTANQDQGCVADCRDEE